MVISHLSSSHNLYLLVHINQHEYLPADGWRPQFPRHDPVLSFHPHRGRNQSHRAKAMLRQDYPVSPKVSHGNGLCFIFLHRKRLCGAIVLPGDGTLNGFILLYCNIGRVLLRHATAAREGYQKCTDKHVFHIFSWFWQFSHVRSWPGIPFERFYVDPLYPWGRHCPFAASKVAILLNLCPISRPSEHSDENACV